MSWKETSSVDERFRFVVDYESGNWSMAELCRRYGISRPCGYKWLRRYEKEGLDGLEDRSRARHFCPRTVDAKSEGDIVALRRAHMDWGPRKLRAVLMEKYPGRDWPACSTIGDIVDRHGLVVARRMRRRASPTPVSPYDGLMPNEVWAVDFKGWFRTGDGARCDPLTLQDHASRWLFRCQAARVCFEEVRGLMEAAFREFGIPEVIRSDNGAPFASTGIGGLSRLSVWWKRLGIRHQRIRPGHPQDNGRLERFHKTLKEATASPPAATLRAQQACFDRFRREYNEVRPHEALGQRPPAACYTPSPRPYPSRIPPVEYPEGMAVRTVEKCGQIKFHGKHVVIGLALRGEHIGLEALDERYWCIYFSDLVLGVVDSRLGRRLNRVQARRKLSAHGIPINI
jgi:putative transposase